MSKHTCSIHHVAVVILPKWDFPKNELKRILTINDLEAFVVFILRFASAEVLNKLKKLI